MEYPSATRGQITYGVSPGRLHSITPKVGKEAVFPLVGRGDSHPATNLIRGGP